LGLVSGCGQFLCADSVDIQERNTGQNCPVSTSKLLVLTSSELQRMEDNMKLQDIGNMTTFRSSGRVRKVGNWSFYDNDDMERIVYHYGTMMGSIVNNEGTWNFVPISTGWGSVSDQGGMNKIIRNFGWYYSRKGGEAKYLQG